MAGKKGKGNKGKGGAQPKRIKLYSFVKTLPDKFKVLITVITRDEDMKTAGNQNVKIYNGMQTLVKRATSNSVGRIRVMFELPLNKAGEKITIRAELEGEKFSDEISIQLPVSNKGRTIDLTAGSVTEQKGYFEIIFEIEVTEPNGYPGGNVEVILLGHKNQTVTPLTTDSNGKVYYTQRLPLSQSEKKLRFRAEIKGAHKIENHELVEMPKAKYKGLKGHVVLWKHNWDKQKKPKFVLKFIVIGVISCLLKAITENHDIAFTVMAGLIVAGFTAIGEGTYRRGLLYGGIFVLVSWIFPVLTVGAVNTAASWLIFPGLPLYIYEDLSEKNGEKSNVFPWVLIWIFAVLATINLLSMLQVITGAHIGFLRAVQDWLQSITVDLSLLGRINSHLKELTFSWPQVQHVYAFADRIKDSAAWLAMTLHWVVVSIIILFASAYDEIVRKFQKKDKGGKSDDSLSAGKFVILDHLFDKAINNISKIFGKKSK